MMKITIEGFYKRFQIIEGRFGDYKIYGNHIMDLFCDSFSRKTVDEAQSHIPSKLSSTDVYFYKKGFEFFPALIYSSALVCSSLELEDYDLKELTEAILDILIEYQIDVPRISLKEYIEYFEKICGVLGISVEDYLEEVKKTLLEQGISQEVEVTDCDPVLESTPKGEFNLDMILLTNLDHRSPIHEHILAYMVKKKKRSITFEDLMSVSNIEIFKRSDTMVDFFYDMIRAYESYDFPTDDAWNMIETYVSYEIGCSYSIIQIDPELNLNLYFIGEHVLCRITYINGDNHENDFEFGIKVDLDTRKKLYQTVDYSEIQILPGDIFRVCFWSEFRIAILDHTNNKLDTVTIF